MFNSLIFRPPKGPPSYQFNDKNEAYFNQSRYDKFLYGQLCSEEFYFPLNINYKYNVPILFFKHSKSNDKTILYSHGNGSDIGYLHSRLMTLCLTWEINIACYDYCGYGVSNATIKPNEQTCYDDIETVYNFLIQEKKIARSKIILYGTSLGSGPTIECANKHFVECKHDIILESPFLSIMDIISESFVKFTGYTWFDNKSKISILKENKIFILHGNQDTLVPISHAYKLVEISNAKIFVFNNCGHNLDHPFIVNIEQVSKFLGFK